MAIHVSEPGRPIGTRLPEIFRDRPVDHVTELVEEHAINPRRNDTTDPEVLNAEWPATRRAVAQYGESIGSEPETQRAYLPAAKLATDTLFTLPASASLAEGLTEMGDHGIDHLIVIADNNVAGLVDRTWLLAWLHDNHANAMAYSFSQIELPAFLTASPETDAHQLARLMLAHRLDASLIIDHDGQVVGIVTGTDYLRLYAEQSRNESSV